MHNWSSLIRDDLEETKDSDNYIERGWWKWDDILSWIKINWKGFLMHWETGKKIVDSTVINLFSNNSWIADSSS